MTNYIKYKSLDVCKKLFDFIENEALIGLDIDKDNFWDGLQYLLTHFSERNSQLLQRRADFQEKIDQWIASNPGAWNDAEEQASFLSEIGYLTESPPDFSIETKNVDPEIANIAAPQLVVPASNARFLLNAANARWGSLYDALYGSDAIGYKSNNSVLNDYDAERGERVIAWGRDFLDQNFSLANNSYRDTTGFKIVDGQLEVCVQGNWTTLLEPEKFVGYKGDIEDLESILLCNNGLHVIIDLDTKTTVGKQDKANISNIILESALTTIIDCEDSVAAVDGEDKTALYRNWLGLMKGDLEASFVKNGRSISRKLQPNREYKSLNNETIVLNGRSLMLVRNVGHHMVTPAVRWKNEQHIPEGILDALFTVTIALHDSIQRRQNSSTGAIYVVKPKMHGPQEVVFTCDLMSAVEDILGLERYTVKIGIMDEERRTSANLDACIYEARQRVVFINTGFLDRTGDEIFTLKDAGPFRTKANIKSDTWFQAYENRNVAIGLATGFSGVAQIGKGMWAKPDAMSEMLVAKAEHINAGASCAWVPSPTAATLHAVHYHQKNVADIQRILSKEPIDDKKKLLFTSIIEAENLTQEQIESELYNNIQSLLGYVVKWVNQGIGCSKVPDINNIGLMEDRATLRISSQHIANWLYHGICTPNQINDALVKMTGVVDEQNKYDADYVPFGSDLLSSIAFKTAKALIFEGRQQPCGYTEFILSRGRLAFKKHNNH